jgi:lipid-A-disaccharide synthase
MKPFVFICAGEDSGDILGEFVVRAVREYGFEAFGVGGHRMEQAGLHTIEHFENFPV